MNVKVTIATYFLVQFESAVGGKQHDGWSFERVFCKQFKVRSVYSKDGDPHRTWWEGDASMVETTSELGVRWSADRTVPVLTMANG